MYAVHEDCVAVASAWDALLAASAFADEGLDAEAGRCSACKMKIMRC